jgi:hypothetical protein
MMEDLDESPVDEPAVEPRGIADSPRADITPREWVSPGVSLRKRVITGIGVALVAILFVAIALYERTSMVVSTIIGAVFILGFVGYLRVVAPKPFTLRLDTNGMTRTDKGAEPAMIPWGSVVKVKEELFKNGLSISLAVFKRVGERGLHRAWVVYRDDIPDYDGFARALREALPRNAQWLRETAHE